MKDRLQLAFPPANTQADPMLWFWIMIGGAFGAGTRHAVSIAADLWLGKPFPYGTLAVNVSGSLAIGILFVLIEPGARFDLGEGGRGFFITGLLGGFTTFSAFSLQTLQLLDGGQWNKALANVFLNVFLCLLACAIGLWLARGFAESNLFNS